MFESEIIRGSLLHDIIKKLIDRRTAALFQYLLDLLDLGFICLDMNFLSSLRRQLREYVLFEPPDHHGFFEDEVELFAIRGAVVGDVLAEGSRLGVAVPITVLFKLVEDVRADYTE